MSEKITKNKKEHVIPTSPQLIALVEESRLFTSQSPFLICSRLDPSKPMPTSSLAQVLQRYCQRKGMEPFVPRDLRRTCKTLMTKHRIGTMETRNRLHNHALNDVSNKHYNKYDYWNEKLEILCDWGDFLDALVKKTNISLASRLENTSYVASFKGVCGLFSAIYFRLPR